MTDKKTPYELVSEWSDHLLKQLLHHETKWELRENKLAEILHVLEGARPLLRELGYSHRGKELSEAAVAVLEGYEDSCLNDIILKRLPKLKTQALTLVLAFHADQNIDWRGR